eukprot:COSAG06_NODE_1144_length_10539_cov_5.861686_4_plen_176_part_00
MPRIHRGIQGHRSALVVGWVNKNGTLFFHSLHCLGALGGTCFAPRESVLGIGRAREQFPRPCLGTQLGLGNRDPPHAHSAVRETNWGTKPLRQKRGRSGGFRGADAPADCSLSRETTTRALTKTPTSQIPTGGWRGQQPHQAARGPPRAGRLPAPLVRCRGAARAESGILPRSGL